MIELQHPECLLVDGKWVGGSQEWYPIFWQRMSGCGPTNAALLMWYLAQIRTDYAKLCDVGECSKADFQRVMAAMFQCVKPGYKGVNSGEKFINGLSRYVALRGGTQKFISLHCDNEIAAALANDLPVAFLNLHSGNQKQLDAWHWMTIIAYDAQNGQTKCCDQGKILAFSLKDWLMTTKREGAFVTLDYQEDVV